MKSATPGCIGPFKIKPHVLTDIPVAVGSASATLLPILLKNQDVIRLSFESKTESPCFISIDLARGAGLAAIAWMIRLPDGREHNLTGASSTEEISKAFEKDVGNRYRDNLFFQKGSVATLYPITNRVRGDSSGEGFVAAVVSRMMVKMPVNNKAAIAGAIPHHLHGLVYGQSAVNVNVKIAANAALVCGDFLVGETLWTGLTKVTTTNEISAQGVCYSMNVKNLGATPVPVGAGAHPYFSSPDSEPDSIKIFVPAKKILRINNLSDVLPTGEIISLSEADPALDFTDPNGTELFAKEMRDNPTESRIDHLWLDLEKDKEGFVYCEIFFPRSHFKVRMTAESKNIIGIQGYAPKYIEGQKPFVALEMVTNLPDPREALWGAIPTGMTVLEPGDEFKYGYRLELIAT